MARGLDGAIIFSDDPHDDADRVPGISRDDVVDRQSARYHPATQAGVRTALPPNRDRRDRARPGARRRLEAAAHRADTAHHRAADDVKEWTFRLAARERLCLLNGAERCNCIDDAVRRSCTGRAVRWIAAMMSLPSAFGTAARRSAATPDANAAPTPTCRRILDRRRRAVLTQLRTRERGRRPRTHDWKTEPACGLRPTDPTARTPG